LHYHNAEGERTTTTHPCILVVFRLEDVGRVTCLRGNQRRTSLLQDGWRARKVSTELRSHNTIKHQHHSPFSFSCSQPPSTDKTPTYSNIQRQPLTTKELFDITASLTGIVSRTRGPERVQVDSVCFRDECRRDLGTGEEPDSDSCCLCSNTNKKQDQHIVSDSETSSLFSVTKGEQQDRSTRQRTSKAAT
jgi:hypothetical protein